MQQVPIRSFTQLIAWQKAREVRMMVRALVKGWPVEEKYRLTDQIIRSSRGPCSHIAEGFGRFYEKENIRFCRIAMGSLPETQDHLSAAYDEGYIDGTMLKRNWAMVEGSIRVINGYIRYLKRFNEAGHVAEPAVPYGGNEDIFGADPLGTEELSAGPAPKELDNVQLRTDN